MRQRHPGRSHTDPPCVDLARSRPDGRLGRQVWVGFRADIAGNPTQTVDVRIELDDDSPVRDTGVEAVRRGAAQPFGVDADELDRRRPLRWR